MMEGSPDPAGEAFAQFLQRREAGDEVDFGGFLAEHPDVAAELESLHRDWLHLQRVLQRLGRSGVAASPTRAHGPGADPAATPADIAPETMARLSARREAFGRYELKGELARGGQGAILRVWDLDLRRNLAMKVILGKDGRHTAESTPGVDSRTLGRFLEEAQVTGQLDHPGIVPVHELGLDDQGRVYFTMKLVKGEDLRTVLDKVRAGEDGWSTTRALGVLLKVCEAMAYAHAKQVIHRDLKPGNVMVGRFGEVYVMDWGLARVLEREDDRDIRVKPPPEVSSSIHTDVRDAETPADSPLVTMDGDIVGTPAYMPPEQARGDLDAMGPHSDVYSVGAILYHLLVGHMPYVSERKRVNAYAIWAQLQDGAPEPLHTVAPDTPPELEAICEKAMARRVEDRYRDMSELAADLAAYLEGRVVRAYQAGAWAEAKKWVLRNRALAAAIGGLFLFLVVGLTVSVVLKRSADRNARLFAQSAEESRRLAEEARRMAYASGLSAALAAIEVRRFEDAGRRLADCPEELRGWEWRHLVLRQDPTLRSIQAEDLGAAAASPDGELIAFTTPGRLRVVRADTDELLADLEVGGRHAARALAFVPDGGGIVVGDPETRTLRRFRPDGQELSALRPLGESPVARVELSPDGLRIACGTQGLATIQVLDAETGAIRLTRRQPGEVARCFALSGDGLLAASSPEGDALVVWDVETDRELARFPGEGASSVSFSPGGRMLAAGYEDGSVRLFGIESDQLLFERAAHQGRIVEVRFCRAGERLVSASIDGSMRLWDASSGWPYSTIRGHDGPILTMDTCLAGELVLTASEDGTVRLWDAGTRVNGTAIPAERAPEISLAGVETVAVADDARHLLVAYADRIEVLDAESALPVRNLDLAAGARTVALSVAPSGRHVAVARTTSGRRARVELIDLQTGERMGEFAGHELPVAAGSLAFAKDGRVLSGSSALYGWDPADGQASRPEELGGPALLVDARADLVLVQQPRRLVARGIERDGILWTAVLSANEVTTTACASADGRLVAVGCESGTIEILDASTGEQAARLEGHTGAITCLRFLPDASRLLSGSADATLRVWSPRNAQQLLMLRGHEGAVTALATYPDGERVVTGSVDGTIRVWDTELERARRLWRVH